jgi:hypothetical protein
MRVLHLKSKTEVDRHWHAAPPLQGTRRASEIMEEQYFVIAIDPPTQVGNNIKAVDEAKPSSKCPPSPEALGVVWTGPYHQHPVSPRQYAPRHRLRYVLHVIDDP